MPDVFLSYARPRMDDAMRIADCLRSAGYSVWYDESLPAHRAYSDVIAEQLDAASAVVVLWSAEAAQSQWVRSEANRARESGRLVQLRLLNRMSPCRSSAAGRPTARRRRLRDLLRGRLAVLCRLLARPGAQLRLGEREVLGFRRS